MAGEVETSGRHHKRGGGDQKMSDEPHALRWRALFGLADAVPHCGAKTRRGGPCQSPAMSNDRCRMHEGTSTGPITSEGLEGPARPIESTGPARQKQKLREQGHGRICASCGMFSGTSRLVSDLDRGCR